MIPAQNRDSSVGWSNLFPLKYGVALWLSEILQEHQGPFCHQRPPNIRFRITNWLVRCEGAGLPTPQCQHRNSCSYRPGLWAGGSHTLLAPSLPLSPISQTRKQVQEVMSPAKDADFQTQSPSRRTLPAYVSVHLLGILPCVQGGALVPPGDL